MPTNIRISKLLFILAIALAAITACADRDAPAPHDAVTCPPGMTRAAQQNICIEDVCGNGILDPGEACDDGNRIAGDGCSADCLSTEVCGNGIVDRAVGEVCDHGNSDSGAPCCSDCRSCPELAAPLPLPSSPEPAAHDTATCTQAELQQALAEASDARAKAERESARANQEAERARAAMQSAAHERGPAPRANGMKAHEGEELPRALAIIAELERANNALEQALAAERLQLDDLRTRLASGRSAELQ